MKIFPAFLKGIAILVLTTISLQAQWQQKAGLPGTNNGRHHPVTWAIGDYGYLLTGTTGPSNATKDFFRYNSTNDSWQQLSDFPGQARSFSIGASFNGKGYIGFGMTATGVMLNDLWSYDTATSSWTQLSSCPCQGRRHPTLTINEAEGKIYMGKGDNTQFNMKDWWQYDIATDQWSKLPDFPGASRHHPFHFSVGNHTYTGLGHGGSSIYSDLYRFDPADSSWQLMAGAPGPRVAGTQFTYNGYGFVLSGDGANHQPTNPPAFWGYDPAADSWFSLPPHPGTSRWAPGSFVINGNLYFICGQNGANSQLESDMWNLDLDMALDIEEHRPVFSVYPNPTSGLLHLQLPANFSGSRVKLYTMSGKIVLEQTFEDLINMEYLPVGVYILELTGTNQVSRMRVVKE